MEKIIIPCAIVFMLCLLGSKLSAQYTILYNDAASNPLPTDDVSVCQSEVFVNSARVVISSNAADNSTITITMPPGVLYVPGCMQVVDSNFNVDVTELDISDLGAPVFSIEPADLSAANQFTFEYCRVADCDATAHQMAGGIFKDEIEVCGDDGCVIENNPNLNSYDLSTPSLSLASDGPITAAIGENVCRNVTLTNGGLGYLDSVKYYIIDGPGTVTTSVTTPLGTVLTPILNGDTLCYWLDAAIIAEFGDGDDFLENGEQIMLERCYDVTGCDNDSYYGAYWGCPGVCMSAGEIQQQTNIPNLVPDLSFGFDGDVNKDYCFKGQNAATGGTAVIQRFELCNTGGGAATNLSFELHNNTPGSGTGQNYFTLEQGQIFDAAGGSLGTTSSQTSLYTGNFLQTDCSVETHHRAVAYELEGIIVQPGECIYVEIPTYSNNLTQECDAECNADIAWYYFNRTYSYQDACGINNYGKARAGIAYGGRQLYRYTVDMPTDMRDCDEFDLQVNYSNFYNNTKSTTEGSTEMKIDVSNTGLLYNGSGTEVFKGVNVTVTQVGDTICVIYPHNGVSNGSGTLLVPLKATCATGGGTKSIRMWHEGQYDDNCEGSTYHLKCLSRTYVMHCPDPCPEGGATPKLFTLERISLGLEDLNNDGIPDGTGTADPADVELHRASNCDTLKGTWEIYVHPNTIGPNAGVPFNHLYVEFDLNDLNLNCTYYETENLFEPLPDAVATIFPADGSPSFTCTVTPTIEDTPGAGVDDLAKYDLSSCKDNWVDGDSIVFCALYRVTTAYHASSFNQYVADNEVYSSYIENPTGVNPSDENKYTCDHYNDFMNVYRHYFSPYTPTPQTVNGCDGRLLYYLRYYINTQTGDVWYPNEYRPFTIPDKFTIELDDALAYRPGSVTFAGLPVPDADITHAGGVLTVCNLKQFFQGYGGTLLESDETWSYLLSLNLDPTCDAEPGLYNTRFSGQVIGNGCHSPDMNYIALQNCNATTGNSGLAQIQYDGPQPFLTGGGTVQFSSSTGCWDVILNNGSNNIDAPYTWFYIDGGSNHTVQDAAGAPVAPDANGFYQLGDNPASNSSAYTVCAASSECDTVRINVLSGFGCTAYPADIGDLSCADTVQLIGLPLMSEVQLAFETQPVVPMQLCETQSFGLKMTSAQAAYLNDPRLSMLIPSGTSINNIQVEYPCGSGNIEAASFSQSGNLLLIDVEAHSAMTAEGMPGTIDALAPTDREACITFDMETDCDFISSSGLLFQAFGKRPCGDPAINNGVRVRSQDLSIDGVNQPHGASVTVMAALPELRGCDEANEVEVNIDFVSLGSNMTSPSDSVYITLDPGVDFVSGSVMCCSANPAHCVTYAYDVTDAAGFTTVVLAFPATPIDITNPVNMCFTYEVSNAQDVECDRVGAMNVQVRASAGDIVCTREAGGLCENVQTLTGEKEIIFTTEKTEVNYDDDAVFNCTEDGSIEYNIPITLDSMEIDAGEILVVDIHCVTASGTVGAYVQSEVISGPVAAGTTVTISGTVPPGTCNPEYGIMARIGTPNNDGVDQCICESLEIPSGALICPPNISHEKAFTSLTETAPGEYDVKWTITVTNDGMGEGDYNLNDIPGFDDDIEICGAEYTSDATGNPANPGPLMLALSDTFKLAEDQIIAGGEIHSYCLIVHVKYDPAAEPAVGDGVYTACEDGTLGDPTSGEGLYNQSQLDTDDDGVADEIDEVCTDLPCALTIVSVMPSECDPATSTYDLTVTIAYGAAPDCLINIGGQTFSIDGSGSETFIVTGLTANGAVGVNVSAFFTCEATCFDQETYDAPAACSELGCTTTQVDILCHGDATGSATVTATGGFAPYSYSWNSAPVQTTATATSLIAGTYSVTVTDNNDLESVCSVTITEPVDLTCTVTKNSDISCNGLSDGGATVNPVGGTGSYTYSWTSGETTAIATALAAGTNTVTVTDANGCITTCTVDIVDPPAVTCTITGSSDPTCAATASGTVTVSGTGGTGTLEYSLDGGGFQLGATFTGVSAGAHTITVRDANDCLSTCDITLTDPTALTCTTSEDNPAACGMSNGQATVTPAGGTAPFTYLWDNTETTAQAVALTAGTHSVTVTDANDCVTSCLVVITSTSGLECEITASGDVSCNGAADGSATVTATGGTAPFTYAWSNTASTASITGLSGGTYTVTITDATNCTTICSVTISEATELICTIVKDNDISCNGVTDGGATVSASGGTPGYTYAWTGGETTPEANALASGINFVTITDAAGCTTICEVSIVEPIALSCDIDAFTDLTCNANNSGTITASSTGGTGNIEYSINGGAFQMSGSFSGLAAGTHTVTVRDASGCLSNCSQAISEPIVLTCNAVAEEPTACGMDIGQATVTPAGGTAGYTYLWDNLETTATATSLSAGTHTVIVTDANDCETTCQVVIESSSGLSCEITGSTDVGCNGDADGSATVEASGGTAPYIYAWSNGDDTAAITGLAGGTYNVTITDATNCTTTCSVTIAEATDLLCGAVKNSDVTCNGISDGSAGVEASGGTPGYTYLWTGGATTSVASNLAAGTNFVTVTDADGCSTICEVFILEPLALECSIDASTNLSCNEDQSGSITVSATGGTGVLEYSIDGGPYQTGGNFTGLDATIHTITVRDENGCTTTCVQALSQPTALTCMAFEDEPTACGLDNGQASVLVNGGIPGYTYLWDNLETTATATTLSAGTHTVTVTDDNGCTTTCQVVINSTSGLACEIISSTNVSCNGAADGTAEVQGTGGSGPYTYVWSNMMTTAAVSGLAGGVYDVVVTDADGCSTECTVTIEEASLLTCTIVKDNDISCNGLSDGGATVSATGGTPGYSYVWSSGETTVSASLLVFGTNSVTITDAAGCTTICEIEIIEPTPVTCSIIDFSDLLCNGDESGTITVSGTGGTGALEFSIDGGPYQSGGNFIGLDASLHTVTVRDAEGCTSTCSQELAEPVALTCTVVAETETACMMASGSATVTPVGGTAGYTYLWDNLETTATAVALDAGTHTVVVTDANNCTTSCQVVIGTTSGLTCEIISSNNVSCAGASDGAAEVAVVGGNGPYTYAWSDGTTTAAITGLSGGTYSVIVTDTDGCSTDCSVTITEATSLLCNISSVVDISCFGESDGGATVEASGGVPGYTYAWPSGETSAVAVGLAVGVNTVTITDSEGCTTTCDVTIVMPEALTCSLASTPSGCQGQDDGTITTTIVGGVAPFMYSINGGANQTGAVFNNLAVGSYTVVVTDANGCTTDCIIDVEVTGCEYDLSLIKKLTPGETGVYNPGDDVSFTITVCNQGQIPAEYFEVTDYIPTGMVFNASNAVNTANGWVGATGASVSTTVSVANGQLPAGGLLANQCYDIIVVTTVDLNAPQGTTITNHAEISDDDGDDMDSTADNDDSNDGPPTDDETGGANGDEDDHDPEEIVINFFDLALTKALANGQATNVAPGDNVTFTITVYNQGTIAADNIEVTDYIPSCMENADSNWAGSAAGPVVTTLSVVNGDLATGGLLPGDFVQVDITLKVADNADSSCDLTNWSEISNDTDANGNPIDDTDSTSDNDDGNDTFGGDDEVDGGNGDEDDHDPASVALLEFDLALSKDLAPGQASAVAPGDLVTYSITIINQGQFTTDSIEITDYIPACMTLADADWTAVGANATYLMTVANGDIAAGGLVPMAMATVEITLLLDNPVGPTCDLTNVAEISGDKGEDTDSTPDGDDSNDPSDEDDIDDVPISLLNFDLALSKDLAAGQVNTIAPGDDITFTISVVNQGNINADSIEITDYLPSCTSLNDADWTDLGTTATYVLTVADGDIPVGGLPPNGVTSVDVTLRLDDPVDPLCDMTNWAEISSATDEDGMPQEDDDSTPDNDDSNDPPGEDDIDDEPFGILGFDLALSKGLAAGQSSSVAPGDLITYEITVVNQGQITTDSIEITDYIPACMMLADADWTASGTNATYLMTVADGDIASGGLVPGAMASVEITLLLDNPVGVACDLTNVAEISGDKGDDTDSTPDGDDSNDPAGEDDIDEVPVDLLDFDLALSKDLATGQASAVAPGDDITFTISIVNQGNINADSIEITDYLPSCTSLNDADWTDLGTTATYVLTVADGDIPVGGLPPNGVASVDVTLRLDDPVDPLCDMTNWAEISSATDEDGMPQEDIDSTPDNDDSNDAPDEDDIDDEPFTILEFDLALSKDLAAGQSSAVAPGDLITYDITVVNQGQFATDSIEITDYIPTCMTLADADWTVSGTDATYLMTVANGDISAGGLLPGAMASVEITLLLDNPVDPACNLTNVAEISGDKGDDTDSTPDGDDSNDPANEDDIDDVPVVLLDFDLALSKELKDGQASAIAPGDDITFTISVVNQGNINADSIEITDYLPSCTSLNDADWTDLGTTATYILTVADGDIPAGGLIPNGVASVDITLKLDNPLDAAVCDMTNWAEISSATDEDGMPQEDTDSDPDNDPSNDPAGEDDIDDEPFDVLEFDLALSKSLTAGQTSDVMPGDDVTFTFTIFNQGQIPADNIEVTDYIPADFALNDADWSGVNPAFTTLTVLNGDLPSGGLLPGQSTTVDITLTVLMTAVNGETYINYGEISDATDEGGDPQEDVDSDPDNDPNNDPNGEDDVDNQPLTIMGQCDLSLIKKCGRFESNGDGTGGQIVFDLIVTNQGGCMAYNIGLIDYTLPNQDMVLNDNDWFLSPFGGFPTYTIPGPLAPGEIDTVEITFDITTFDPDNPQINFAEITGSQDFNGDDQEDDDSDPDTDPINDGAPVDDEQNGANNDEDDHDYQELCIMDLAIDKSLDPSMVGPYAYGDDITFNICVTNQGNMTASSIVIADYIPAGFTYDPAINSSWTGAAPTVNYTFAGPVAPGDEVCVDIVLEFNANGASAADYTNVTEITEVYDEDGDQEDDDWDSTPDNDDGDQSEDDEDNEVFEVFDLELEKTITTQGPYSYGQDVVFEMQICNTGSVVAQNVVVEDRFPCGYELISSAGWTESGGAVSTTIAGPLNPSDCEKVSLTLRVQACSAADAYLNVSEIIDSEDGDGNPRDDIDSEEDNDDPSEDDQDDELIDIYDLALQKVIDDRGPYLPGEIVEFKFNIYNQGNVAASNIVITDYLNTGFIFTAGGANVGWASVGNYAEYTYAGPLAPGDVETISIFLEITIPAGATYESWTNEGEISGSDGDDADSTADDNPDNDNDVTPGDDNDDEIDEQGDGDDEDDNDVADVLVTGEIGDTVWKDLNNDGIQDVNEPGVGNVVVTLYDCNGVEIRQVTTDASGYYLFDLLLPGDYQLNFDISGLPAGCDFTFPGQGAENEDSDADLNGNTTCITLEAGENNHDVDVGLLNLTAIGNYVWHDLDGDGTQDAGEPGLGGVTVKLFKGDGTYVGSTTTDSNGFYLFDGLYPGDYYLEFTPPSQYPLTTDANQGNDTELDSDIDNSNGPNTTTITYLSGDADLSWDAGFYKCVPIGELVWYDLNENHIADDNENGINGLEIELYRRVNGTWTLWDSELTGHKPGTPSDDGYFKFCAPPGEYHLKANVPAYGLVAVTPHQGNDETKDSDFDESNGPNTSETFTVLSGQEKCDLAAGFYTQSSVGSFVWNDENGDGVRQGLESVVPGVLIEAYDIYNDLVGSATSDEEGQYNIANLRKEGYYLKVYPPSGLKTAEAHKGNDDTMDSDVDHSNGLNTTDYIMMEPGTHVSNVDIGLIDDAIEPFDILNFGGRYRPDFVELSWMTKSESEIVYYEIEKRHETDSEFNSLGRQPVKGIDSNYDVNDYDVERDGIYYYRLRTVDNDGIEQISDEISVDITSIRNDGVSIYPNPAISDVNIEVALDVSKLVKVDIYNTQGRLIKASLYEGKMSKGVTNTTLDVSDIPSGVYNVQIQLGDKLLTKRLILLSN